VLSVGHLQRVKGFDRLVEAWPAVRMAAGDVRLVLAGSARGERGFKRRLLRQIDVCNARYAVDGGGPCVSYVGPKSSQDLNLLLNAADLTVIASRSEGWNNAISESLATGTPVVATDVGGNAEQLCSTELGVMVPDGDVDRLAGAIVYALQREWNRPLIAAHGASRPWSIVAREVYQVFQRTIREKKADAGCPVIDVLNGQRVAKVVS
jgi:glycosyltransferase involved in cell wall biosynthesis